MSYRVYEISSSVGYDGIAIVAADNAEAANVIIKNFKDDDPQNREDSFGFKFVTEDDLIPELSSHMPGIILNRIIYIG